MVPATTAGTTLQWVQEMAVVAVAVCVWAPTANASCQCQGGGTTTTITTTGSRNPHSSLLLTPTLLLLHASLLSNPGAPRCLSSLHPSSLTLGPFSPPSTNKRAACFRIQHSSQPFTLGLPSTAARSSIHHPAPAAPTAPASHPAGRPGPTRLHIDSRFCIRDSLVEGLPPLTRTPKPGSCPLHGAARPSRGTVCDGAICCSGVRSRTKYASPTGPRRLLKFCKYSRFGLACRPLTVLQSADSWSSPHHFFTTTRSSRTYSN